MLDSRFHGARLPGRGKGAGWRENRLGLERYDGLEKIWYGTPNATKRAISETGIAGTIPFWTSPTMKLTSYAEVSVNFPDELTEEGGEIINHGEQAFADAVAEILRDAGYTPSAPEFVGDHGWDLNVYIDRRRIWLEIQSIGEQEYVLQTEAMIGFFQRLRGFDPTFYAKFLSDLNQGLKGDPRFGRIQWFVLGKENTPIGHPLEAPPPP